MIPAKRYLGDGVYVAWDGFAFVLTVENGVPDNPLHEIHLEPEVYAELEAFALACFAAIQKAPVNE